jgi:hypothetical protein
MGISRHVTFQALSSLPELSAVVAVYALRFPDAVKASGMSRSTLYRHAAAGRLILRKSGTLTLVDAESLRQLIESLPVLEVVRAEVGIQERNRLMDARDLGGKSAKNESVGPLRETALIRTEAARSRPRSSASEGDIALDGLNLGQAPPQKQERRAAGLAATKLENGDANHDLPKRSGA